MSLRVTVASKVKHLRCGAVAKASLNRASFIPFGMKAHTVRFKLVMVDAKPCDLPLGRLKLW